MSRRMRSWAVVLFAATTGAFLAQPAHAASSDQAFTIANYPVEARAKNAVAAKKAAIKDGQAAAFRSLLKRIVPVTAYKSLDRLKGIATDGLIDGISVRSEQNSSTEYIATLDFVFSSEQVRRMLRGQGVPFIDTQAPQIVLVPAYRPGPGAKAGTNLGEWGSIWKDLDLKNTLTPVRVAALKPTVHNDTLTQLESGDTSASRILANEYGSQQVVTAIAEFDPGSKKLRVVLSGRDAVGPLYLRRTYPMSDGDVGYAMEYAAVVSLGILEGRWKAIKARDLGGVATLSGPAMQVLMQVEYGSPRQWYDIQSKLQGISGVENFRTQSVSARSAQVLLNYPGGAPNLAATLARQGLSLTNGGGEWWVLRRSF